MTKVPCLTSLQAINVSGVSHPLTSREDELENKAYPSEFMALTTFCFGSLFVNRLFGSLVVAGWCLFFLLFSLRDETTLNETQRTLSTQVTAHSLTPVYKNSLIGTFQDDETSDASNHDHLGSDIDAGL